MPVAVKRARKNIDRRRRAQIGAEKRTRTRAELLAAALQLFGRPHGRNTRIEDVCGRAHIARGTFYNYFDGIEDLLEALSADLTGAFDRAVHASFAFMDTATLRTCAAMRYYLHAPLLDSRWGWAVVNSSVGRTLYGEDITRHVRESIREGMDSGEFTIRSAEVGRDILLGAGISATISLLRGDTPADYPEQVARHVLLALGASHARADAATRIPMSAMPRLDTDPAFFRGVLGGVDHAAGRPSARTPGKMLRG
jgi:AcrR family transcriptional regulator